MPIWLYSRIFGTPITVTTRWRNNRKIVDKMKAMRDACKNEGFIGVTVHFATPGGKGVDVEQIWIWRVQCWKIV